MSYNPNLDDYVTSLEFFSLRANAWKEIEGVHLSYTFDLVEKSFSEIPLPVDFDCDFNFCDLAVLGESLRLLVF